MVEIRGRPSTHGSKRPRRSQGAISVPKPFPGKAALGIAAGTVRLSAEGFACTKAICNYIHDTYGRFPGGTDARHLMWVMQAHHIDTSLAHQTPGGDHWVFNRCRVGRRMDPGLAQPQPPSSQGLRHRSPVPPPGFTLLLCNSSSGGLHRYNHYGLSRTEPDTQRTPVTSFVLTNIDYHH